MVADYRVGPVTPIDHFYMNDGIQPYKMFGGYSPTRSDVSVGWSRVLVHLGMSERHEVFFICKKA